MPATSDNCRRSARVISVSLHCDDMQGLIRMVAGDGECDAGSVEWSSTATNRITRAAQCVVFSTVMAEARMV